ncbi:MAG: hypothetical protein JWQ35_2181 [Bacteriovoracaceae bacterium]|nr:hypothetical protein [Bacteriovoracaceae bacterium]
MSIVYLTRKEKFSASHRLHSDKLSDEENLRLFGKCNNKNGHGHNYCLEVTIRSELDSNGLTMNLGELKRTIKDCVVVLFDHKNLNLDVKVFKHLNPTAENIAIISWKLLSAKLPKGLLFEVKIHETEKNVATYRGE